MVILMATDVWKSYVDEQFILKSVRLTLSEAEFASIQGGPGPESLPFSGLWVSLRRWTKGNCIFSVKLPTG